MYVICYTIGRDPSIADYRPMQIEEVKGVTQVLDQEEEIAMEEFARFEAKLKEQKGPDAIASNNG